MVENDQIHSIELDEKMYIVGWRERGLMIMYENERERERETDRQTDRETYRQTERNRERILCQSKFLDIMIISLWRHGNHKGFEHPHILCLDTNVFCLSGDSYQSLHYMYRIGRTTIGEIVEETCKALVTVLKDTYLKVRNDILDQIYFIYSVYGPWHNVITINKVTNNLANLVLK